MVLVPHLRSPSKVEDDVEETKLLVPFFDIAHLVLVKRVLGFLPSLAREDRGLSKAIR